LATHKVFLSQIIINLKNIKFVHLIENLKK
jgi:hypothetical protein